MKIGRRKRCGKCRSCGKTKKRFSHSSLDLRSTLPTTPAAAVLPQTQLSFYSPWGYNRGGGIRGAVRRSCTSARKEIHTYERCWCRGRNTFWVRLEGTVTCD